MSRGNCRGGDPLQRDLELQEHRTKLHYDQLPRPPSPVIEVVPIIREGLDYPEVPTKYVYPPDFGVGVTARVAKLNSNLLHSYGLLGERINDHAHAQAILDHNQSRTELKKYQVDQLRADVHCARSSINNMIHYIHLLLGEVDAVGGAEAHHVPDQLQSELGVPRSYLVRSGSLARLAEQPDYVIEECCVPSDVYMGDDTKQGRANQELKDRFESLAFNVNRIRYLIEAGCKDYYLSTLQDKLIRQFDEVDLNTGEGYLTIPTDLNEAIVRILAAKKEKEEQKRKAAETMEKNRVEEMLHQQKSLEMQKRKKKEMQKGKKPSKSPWMT